MPDTVVARYGRYEIVQGSVGWEVREDLAKHRRSHTIVATLLLAAAAGLWSAFGHPIALAFALVGTGVAISGLLRRAKALVLGETEIRYGIGGDKYDRRGVWPRSRVAKVWVEKIGEAPPPALRGRRFGPVFVVRIVARDGAVHPSRFVFRQDALAHDLARAIAEHLAVSVS